MLVQFFNLFCNGALALREEVIIGPLLLGNVHVSCYLSFAAVTLVGMSRVSPNSLVCGQANVLYIKACMALSIAS